MYLSKETPHLTIIPDVEINKRDSNEWIVPVENRN